MWLMAMEKRNVHRGQIDQNRAIDDARRPMHAFERDTAIIGYLENRRNASVEALATLLATSAATIRRDLHRLEQAGLLRRTHGGAVLSNTLQVPAVTTDDEALARSVYQALAPGDAVIFDGQLVMPQVAKMLAVAPMRLIVVTNHLDTARVLLGQPGIEVIFLGGKLNPGGYTLPQPLGASDLKFLVANKAFVEVEGVHPTAGITTMTPESARFKHDLLQHALSKTVVAPFGRWGLSFPHRITLVSEVDCWITTQIDPARRDELAGLKCVLKVAPETAPIFDGKTDHA
ncbi:MAG: DeoR/GlpR family DNA-binding transcription regulator [Candidatus Dormibacteria bacterium]